MPVCEHRYNNCVMKAPCRSAIWLLQLQLWRDRVLCNLRMVGAVKSLVHCCSKLLLDCRHCKALNSRLPCTFTDTFDLSAAAWPPPHAQNRKESSHSKQKQATMEESSCSKQRQCYKTSACMLDGIKNNRNENCQLECQLTSMSVHKSWSVPSPSLGAWHNSGPSLSTSSPGEGPSSAKISVA